MTAGAISARGRDHSPDQRAQLGGALRRAFAQLDRHRYLALSALVFVLMLSQTLKGNWGGDFWEHAASVRELARAPFDPNHPLLALDKPHVDFGPYLLALGLFSKATGLSAVATLELAGLVLLVAFLIGFRLFVRVFSERTTAPFYALLFLLLLYGWHPWAASGLFHLNTLGGVLSFPSTFSVTVGFFTIALFARWLRENGKTWWLAAVAVMSATAVITHPVSAVLIYPTMAVLVLHSRRATETEVLIPVALAVVASVGLALLWPYFSLVTLFNGDVSAYESTNSFIYEAALKRLLPLLLLVPIVWIRLRRDWRDPLALLTVLFALLYVYGDVSNHWNWGRTISFLLIVGFTLLGDFAAELETGLRDGTLGGVFRVALPLAAAAVLAIELVNMRTGITHSLPGTDFEDDPGTSRFAAYPSLFRGTGRDAVTLAGLRAGRGIPVYAGKIVANTNPEAFIDDHPQRQQDVRRFFKSSLTLPVARSIVDRYDVSYILVDRKGPPGSTAPLAILRRIGPVIRDKDGLILIRVRSAT